MANENTVSIEYTADGSAAIAAANSTAAESNAAVDKMNKGAQDSASAMATTWRQFTSERMSEYMRLEGGHNAAMKRMSEEWQAYKASGVMAASQVSAATTTYYDRVTNDARTASAAQIAVMKAAAEAQIELDKKLAAESNAYRSAGVSASKEVAQAMENSISPADRLVAKLKNLAAEALGVFAAFKILEAGKDTVMFAANVEQANRALSVIANNMGHTSAEAMKYRDAMRDLGITTNSSTNATAQFLRASLPMDKLNVLARSAQGAAISYAMMTGETISSSEALDKMVRAIITGNVHELHTLGITVMMKDALRENKIATGEAASAVDSHQRHMMLLNATIEQSGPLLNLYTASMDLASKKISSSKRPVEELKLAFGELFLPELTVAATAFYDVVSGGMLLVRAHTEELTIAKQMIKEFAEGLLYGAAIMGVYSAAVVVATAVTGGLAAGAGIFSGVLSALTMNISLTGAAAVTASARVGVMGESIVTSTTAATVGLNSVKTALGVLSAFMVGWEFGKMLNARFQSVRDFGTEVVWGLMVAWHNLVVVWETGVAVLSNLFDLKAMDQAVEKIEAQRAAWMKTWEETRAQQLKDNAAFSDAVTVAKPVVDDKAAIARGIAAEKARLAAEQKARDEAAAIAAEKARKNQAEISEIIEGIRARDLEIGKSHDEKALIQLQVKHQKEIDSLKAKHASQAQLNQAYQLQAKESADLAAEQTLIKQKADALAEAQIARKSFEEKAAWLKKLDDYKLKSGQLTESAALENQYDRERDILALKSQEIDKEILAETHEKKRLELIGQRQTLQNQINHSYDEEAEQIAQVTAKENTAAFAHSQKMYEILAASHVAQLHFLHEAEGALVADYAWKRELLDRQHNQDLVALDLTQTQKLQKEREYQEKSFKLEQDKALAIQKLEREQVEQKWTAASQSTGALMNLTQAFLDFSGKKNKELFEINKMAAYANAVVNTAQGATKALAELSYPWNLFAAASVVAAGLVQIESISSTTFAGGGSASTSSPATASVASSLSSGTASTSAQASAQTAAPVVVNLNLYGINYGVDTDKLARDIYPAIRRAANDGVR